MSVDESGVAIYKTENGDSIKGSDLTLLLDFVLAQNPSKTQNRPFDLLYFLRVLKKSGANSSFFPPKIFPYLRKLLQDNA